MAHDRREISVLRQHMLVLGTCNCVFERCCVSNILLLHGQCFLPPKQDAAPVMYIKIHVLYTDAFSLLGFTLVNCSHCLHAVGLILQWALYPFDIVADSAAIWPWCMVIGSHLPGLLEMSPLLYCWVLQ